MKAITPIIDYKKIAEAKDFYEDRGFVEIPVPWILDEKPYLATKPQDSKDFYVLGGYMNASGEQGFIELMLRGVKIERNLTITSCFREESKLDEIHHKYFVKLELIDTVATKENLFNIIACSKEFFDSYMPNGMKTKIIEMDASGETYDIIDPIFGIELGSYGIRTYKHLKWIYGTGIALPRLDTVITKIKNKKHV